MLSLGEELSRKVRGRVKTDEPMRRHTSFGIGGDADLWVEPVDVEEMRAVLEFANGKGLMKAVFGNGSNYLVRDEGFRGIIISTKGLDGFRRRGDVVLAGGGLSLKKLLGATIKMGLTGLEFSAGIPATVGGAVMTNAGGKFGEMGTVVKTLKVASDRDVSVRDAGNLRFSYRSSGLEGCGAVIVEAELKFLPAEAGAVRRKVSEIFGYRRKTQPLEFKSAGCIFKNPGLMSAGNMISAAGLGGKRIGDAEISSRHANFIVNRGRASASDVMGLIRLIEEEIYRVYNIGLEREVEIIGG